MDFTAYSESGGGFVELLVLSPAADDAERETVIDPRCVVKVSINKQQNIVTIDHMQNGRVVATGSQEVSINFSKMFRYHLEKVDDLLSLYWLELDTGEWTMLASARDTSLPTAEEVVMRSLMKSARVVSVDISWLEAKSKLRAGSLFLPKEENNTATGSSRLKKKRSVTEMPSISLPPTSHPTTEAPLPLELKPPQRRVQVVGDTVTKPVRETVRQTAHPPQKIQVYHDPAKHPQLGDLETTDSPTDLNNTLATLMIIPGVLVLVLTLGIIAASRYKPK